MSLLPYYVKYQLQLMRAMSSIDDTVLDDAYDIIFDWVDGVRPILVFGNGGSAAVAEHLATDWTKGIAHDSANPTPAVISLSSNHALMTALANDYGYDQVFAQQIAYHNNHDNPGVIAISSSGNSPNIVEGLKKARALNLPSIALVGFDGGKVVSERLADFILHVKSCNYGIVEDTHSIIMHAIAQQLRLSLSSTPDAVKL